MDQSTLLIVLIVFVALCWIALLVQMGTLLGMFLVLRKVQGQVTAILPEVQKIIGTTRRIVDKSEGHIDKIGASSAAILDVTKQQVGKIDELLNDATTRARVQIQRAEMVLDDTMGRAQETVSIVQRTVLRPVREVHGILAGVKTTLSYLGRGTRPTVDHVTSDEEMFI